jgi:hypothetical protein
MQRALRVVLTGAAFLLLASCGGGGTPDSADSLKQPQAAVTNKGGNTAATSTGRAYIVQLKEPSVAAYAGGIRGFASTRPARGSKLDASQPTVVNYRGHLSARQDAVLRSVGGAKKLHSYGYTFNGFAAELTQAQADKLAANPDVLAVTKDQLLQLDTASTPGFLGLTGKEGFWKQQAKGEDIIIGIVDSGVWPEHKSFSDRKHLDRDDKDGENESDYDRIRGWKGTCVTGAQFTTKDCNRKLIGARYYNAGWGGDAAIAEFFPFEFLSPRDWGGHGTHTASTAGGNANVRATGDASVFGSISGIAPRARIAVYKVCWATTPLGGGCFGSDSVAAIDQAVADGVDVINFSISGTSTNFRDPVEIAFLNAADAGVFVAASAGNSGPAGSTVAHPSPWITTVAAGTHNRDGRGSVTLGGATYSGASVASAVGPVATIDSAAAALRPADAAIAALCFAADDNGGTPVLDPAKVAGKIVVCDRGANARINKSLAVQQAGGVGMILVNTSANSINADFHFVPTVHLAHTDRAAVKAAAAALAAATINPAQIIFDAAAPFTATFSSRGPLLAGNGNLLKPDIIAPGQDILAAVAPPGNNGRLFDIYSGTSMSSPHVAGLAALLKEVHPKWSPMAIKSALMTTAGDVLDGPTTNPQVIFRQGAGHVQPNNAADPGLVFDSDFDDWLGFLCGTQLPTSFCTAAGVPVLNPSNLNMASIAIGSLAGVQTVTRRVTNVSDGHATYRASVEGMTGFDVKVTPAALTLARGQTKSFTVTFTRTSATLQAYTGGQLILSGGTSKKARDQHRVRVPMVARPVALSAPTQVSGSYNVTFGFDGAFSASARGLIPAALTSGTVADDPTNGACSLTAPNAIKVPVTVAAGTTYARFSLFDADVSAGADIDMCVFRGTTQVGASGSGSSAEEVNLVDPVAGDYTVVVHGWGVAGSSSFKLHTWLLGATAAGNMTVAAPTTATTGGTASIGLAFGGLAAGRYLGSVAYSSPGVAGLPNPTIVRVDQP